MKKIAYTRLDGGVSIVIPAPKEALEKVLGPLTDEQYEAHVRKRSIPTDAINVHDVEDESFLTDREFRDAWISNGSAILHNLEKAKDIQLKRIRLARESKLEVLDKEFMLAIERGDDVAKLKVTADKQTLRDITEPLKALVPISIEDIRAAFPAELKGV